MPAAGKAIWGGTMCANCEIKTKAKKNKESLQFTNEWNKNRNFNGWGLKKITD